MGHKPQPPPYFKTKKWALLLTSIMCTCLWYQVCEQTINFIDTKDFQKSVGYYVEDEESTPAQFKTVKRWTKIVMVLVCGAAIIGQLSGMVASVGQYRICAIAHVWINALVGSLLLIGIIKTILLPDSAITSSIPDERIGGWAIGFYLLWIGNIAIGVLYRRDLRMMARQEKLARCTCSYIQQRIAHAQANQINNNQMGILPPPQQYLTGPDGSRYLISRPTPTPNDWMP